MGETKYSLEDIRRATGAASRTVRRWTHQGLLPPPEFQGSATRYTREQFVRAKVVAMLRGQNLRAPAIRKRLARATLAELEAMLPPPPAPPLPTAAPAPPPIPSYPARVFERIELLPGLELHVDTNGGEVLRRIAQAIHQHYGARGA